MRKFDAETAVGIFVLAGLACLAWLSIRLGRMEIVGGDYSTYHAAFSSVAGLRAGAPVEVAGVEVGKVEGIDVKDFRAQVTLEVRRDVPVPEDTIASIRTRGLIGDRYVGLSPGASDRLVPPGGRIRETEPAVDLEEIIGRLLHGKAGEGGEGGGK